MIQLDQSQIFLLLAIFSVGVLIFTWIENRTIRKRLFLKEHEMQRRMYEVAILKELGDRIGYSLNVQKIVDVITGSLGKLLDYSTVSYLLLGEEGRGIFHCLLEEPVNKTFIGEVKNHMVTALSILIGKDVNPHEIDESISGTITDETNQLKIKSFFNVPVVINDLPVGLLNVSSTKANLYTEDEMMLMYTIMNQASAAVSKLENILNQEKGKLNSMVESMADGVFMVDVRSRLLVINPAARQMLGIIKPQPNIFDIFDSLSSELDLRTKIEESIIKDKLNVVEHLKLGSKVLRVLISPVKDGADQSLGAVILFHDITKENEIERLREDFVSMVVHELRSPLSGIRSIANLLKEDRIKKEQKKYEEFIDLIVTNSGSMLDLVNDLLDVAKLESGEFKPILKPTNIADVIKLRVESFMTMVTDSHLKLEVKVEENLPAYLLDSSKISQVFNNLLSNAIKFTPESGKIIVTAFLLKKDENLFDKVASLGMIWPGIGDLSFPADQLILSVIDTGVGIEQEQIKKLFNKFSQLEQTIIPEKKGTGLGLVVTKGIIEAHGGKVGVFSQPQKGSAFYCAIPTVLEPVSAPKA